MRRAFCAALAHAALFVPPGQPGPRAALFVVPAHLEPAFLGERNSGGYAAAAEPRPEAPVALEDTPVEAALSLA